MTSKQAPAQTGPVHFPTSGDKGPFPFPTAASIARRKAGAAPPGEPSAEELRLMAGAMPGEGPGH